MKHTFEWYLHGDNIWESQDEFKRLNSNLPDEAAEHIMNNNPFYEVVVGGIYDDETGSIELISIS
jgi:hypothetical protein